MRDRQTDAIDRDAVTEDSAFKDGLSIDGQGVAVAIAAAVSHLAQFFHYAGKHVSQFLVLMGRVLKRGMLVQIPERDD